MLLAFSAGSLLGVRAGGAILWEVESPSFQLGEKRCCWFVKMQKVIGKSSKGHERVFSSAFRGYIILQVSRPAAGRCLRRVDERNRFFASDSRFTLPGEKADVIWPYEFAVRLVNSSVRSVARDSTRVSVWRHHRVPGPAPSAIAGPVSNSEVPPRLGSESAEVDAALDAWRHKAADSVLSVLSAALLPVAVLIIVGYCPPVAPLPKAAVLAVYPVICATALFRRVEYRRRVVVSVLALYWASFIAILVNPGSPYAQIGVVTFPIYALVLLGSPAARLAAMASTAIIVSAPLLREQPRVIHLLGIDRALEAAPPDAVWFRATLEVGFLFALMVLLSRFHRLLLDALMQRIAAQRKVEDEMNERERLQRAIASVGDAERRRLGQELHDGVCQQVTAALLRCQALERQLQRGGVLSGADFAPLSSLLADTIDDAHDVARGLCPLEPDPDALVPTLRALTKRMQEVASVRCEFLAAGDVRVANREAAQHLYRIAQEALSNAVRHAHANRIAVELQCRDGYLTLQIEDNGAGLPHALPGGGMGLRTMAYRAQILKGELTVGPAPRGGTRVVCQVPLAQVARAT
jgi:signal transduction histidine kinase